MSGFGPRVAPNGRYYDPDCVRQVNEEAAMLKRAANARFVGALIDEVADDAVELRGALLNPGWNLSFLVRLQLF